MKLNKIFEHISLKFGLTITEIKTFLFILLVFIAGFIAKKVKYESLKIEEHKYSYEIYDSLFNAIGSYENRNNDSLKKREKRVDSEVELYDFSNNKKDSKKSDSPFLEPNSINLNTADEKALLRLPGIGKVTAARIIQFREKNGDFKNINELLKIKRIGKKTLKKIKNYLIIEN